ncbi:MAG: hypothetical protein FWD71_05375 [Oscillospiraceae bacterium]|nr:hypothetical protein [Oscillospiraceae bacterium]
MNNSKKIILLFFIVSIICIISVIAVSDVPLITKYYANVYWQYETTAGNGQSADTNQNNNFDTLNEEAKIEIIKENFLKSIDEDKYYGGAYWNGDDLIRDDNGNIVTNEKGKPLRRYDRDLYILITDLKIVPDYLRTANPKLHFREVKYSQQQLMDWADLLFKMLDPATVDNENDYNSIKIWGTGIDTENNRIEISVSEIFDISEMPPQIPKDAYIIEYGGGPAAGL